MPHELPPPNGCLLNLPYELEREIFELTARAYPKCAPQLALVASRVQAWVEAVMYENIVLTAASGQQTLFWRTFSSRPPAFFAKNVRALHLTTSVSYREARRIIAVCTNLASLTCWADPLTSTDGFLALLPPTLRRLSITRPRSGPPRDPPPGPLTPPLHAPHAPRARQPAELVRLGLRPRAPAPHAPRVRRPRRCTRGGMIPLFRDALASEAPRLEMLIVVSRDEHFLCVLELAEMDDARLVCLPNYHHPMSPSEYWECVARKEVQFLAPLELVDALVAVRVRRVDL
ncbi:hypothetical protein B0H10DRAFT_2219346 [Mycena sp. CBHHK59/15]|nr:hypothetical protein B0H10DRAFT_2238440 [Mycena sp. CBHHK59/15]KAJ6591357.1 hypothetical protein B0H10DRAFT_2233393 [Mycena sp. CBHHK59/15]KAJ6616687.1 hypothetical protein B0H10DRAFT_2219346 [Mycena sp. CBHHK59/15]